MVSPEEVKRHIEAARGAKSMSAAAHKIGSTPDVMRYILLTKAPELHARFARPNNARVQGRREIPSAEQIVELFCSKVVSLEGDNAILRSEVVELRVKLEGLSLENASLSSRLLSEEEYRLGLENDRRRELMKRTASVLGVHSEK